MSNQLPIRIEDVRQSIHCQRDSNLVRQAEQTIFEAQLNSEVLAAVQLAEVTALGDAIQASIDEEISILQYGTSLAKNSSAAAQLVAEKVTLFAEINSRRLNHRFRG
jgi:hypothetical protein